MSSADNLDESSAPLIEHLAELRNRLIKSVLAFVVGINAAFAAEGQALGGVANEGAGAGADGGRGAA